MKKLALKPDFETSALFTSYTQEEKEKVKRLISAQNEQGNELELVPVPDSFKIKIVDFGFVQPHTVQEHMYQGTVYYMAPEIHMGQPYQGITADLFALGVILFNMRTK